MDYFKFALQFSRLAACGFAESTDREGEVDFEPDCYACQDGDCGNCKHDAIFARCSCKMRDHQPL